MSIAIRGEAWSVFYHSAVLSQVLNAGDCFDRCADMCVQKAIRHFLKIRNSYDVLPLSFRLIVLDNKLSVEQSLEILLQNGMPSQLPHLS